MSASAAQGGHKILLIGEICSWLPARQLSVSPSYSLNHGRRGIKTGILGYVNLLGRNVQLSVSATRERYIEVNASKTTNLCDVWATQSDALRHTSQRILRLSMAA